MSDGSAAPPARGHLAEGARAHLARLASAPRPAGSAAEASARAYCAEVLAGLGFTVQSETFEYSALPGRYGTPLGGALLALGIAAAAWCGLAGHPRLALVSLLAGAVATMLLARAMLGDAVLDLPFMRCTAENLVARRNSTYAVAEVPPQRDARGNGAQTSRSGGEPAVWLVAHLDCKSQPIPSAARVAGVALMLASLAVAIACVALQLAGSPARTGWWATLALLVLGAPAVIASVVGSRSSGAVDNASGVAAVLSAAALLRAGASVGVLLPSAEELGLAGARAFARTHARATCINCDGVDDDGVVTIMHRGAPPSGMVHALVAATDAPVRVRRMPVGLLTDSVAFTDRGWPAVTVSRGSFGTLRRVHTPQDSLDHLRGDGLEPVAALLARAAEALA